MASLPARTTASFDAIKPVSSLVLLDDELNDMKGAAGFLNGGTTGKKLLIKSSDAADPPIECDQIGAGPLAEWKQNGTLKASIANSGQIVSAVVTGTAPLSVASTTKVDNLNADLLDGISSAGFALSTARTRWTANWTIADPSTFPLNTFNLAQQARIGGAGFDGIDARAAWTTGSASGSFSVDIRRRPTNSASETVLATLTFNSGTVFIEVTAVVNFAFSEDDWIYPVLTARSSPLQRDVQISLKGSQLLS